MALLYVLFTKTALGLSLRAVAQDKTTARMMGINVSRVNNVTFGLCSVLGAVAGIVYAPVAVLTFDMGQLIILKGFTAALLGGLGRSEEHTSELQSLMRISYAVFCLNKKIMKVSPQPCRHYHNQHRMYV